MAFSADDLFALLAETFHDDRRATFDDVASILKRVKQALDADEMTPSTQRRYLKDVLHIEAVLMDRAVCDAESVEHWTEAEARERIQQWLAVFWPTPEEGGA